MIVRSATASDKPAIEAALDRVEAISGREAVSEHKRLRVLTGQSIEVVALEADEIAGYGHAAWHGGGNEPHWAIEVATTPGGTGSAWTAVLSQLTIAVPRSRRRYVWVTRAGEVPLAKEAGWTVDRTLHEMHRPLPIDHAVEVPEGIEIRSFRRGADEAEWLSAHNEAFAGHPEVGGMTPDELDIRLQQPWFDAEGLLVACRGARIVGSCWTKLHAEDVGEIYLIGLRDEAQGIGLGKALVLLGLADLAGRQGARDGMLWVDEANTRAHALYKELGFATRSTIYRMTESDWNS